MESKALRTSVHFLMIDRYIFAAYIYLRGFGFVSDRFYVQFLWRAVQCLKFEVDLAVQNQVDGQCR